VAEVDGQVDLVRLRDVELVAFVLHVHRHELVADLGCVLGVVHQAEILRVHLLLELLVLVELDALALYFLLPPDLVQALPEEYDVHKHDLVETLVHLLRDFVQVKGKNLVHKHTLPVLLAQVVVVAVPLLVLLLLLLGGVVLGLWFAGELPKVLVNGVLGEGLVLPVALEELIINLLEVREGIRRASFSFGGLEVILALRVRPLVGLKTNEKSGLRFFWDGLFLGRSWVEFSLLHLGPWSAFASYECRVRDS